MNKWICLPFAIAVLATCTCAPVEPPPTATAPSTSTADVDKPADVEKIDIVPNVLPDSLRDRIEIVLEQVRQRDLTTNNGFWTIFHGILGLGPSITLRDPMTGERRNALDYICDGGELRGLQFIPTKFGLDVKTVDSDAERSVAQGHQDQYIAEMAQWGMPLQRKFIVHGKDYTFEDFVRHCKMRARTNANQELSWAIVCIGQYYGTNISWKNAAGEKLHFEDLVRYELDQSVETAACGGTHRLFGLAWVYHLHLQKGGRTEGVWKDVAKKIDQYKKKAREYQNFDGSFSTNFYRERGDAADPQLRMNTTGHMVEWLSLAMTDEELREPWMQDAVGALVRMLLDIQGTSMEGGTLYHAVHGLLIYYARVFDPKKLGPNEPLVILPPGAGKADKALKSPSKEEGGSAEKQPR